MPGLEEFLANLSAGVGGGVSPEQSRSALALALLTGGLQTLGSAGTEGIAAIPAGLQTGLGTFGASLAEARNTADRQRALGFEERRLDVREAQESREAEVFAGQKAALDEQEFFFERLRSNPGEVDQIESELESLYGGDSAMRIYIEQSRTALDASDLDSFREATTNLAKRAEELTDAAGEEPEPEDIIFVEKFGVRTPMVAQRDAAGNVVSLSEIPGAPAGVGLPAPPKESEDFPEPPSVSTFLTGARQDARYQVPLLVQSLDEDGLPEVLPNGEAKMVPDFEGRTTFDMNAALKAYYQEILPQFEQNSPSPDGGVTKEQTIQAIRQANPGVPIDVIEQQVSQFFGQQATKTQTDLTQWFETVDWDALVSRPPGPTLDLSNRTLGSRIPQE